MNARRAPAAAATLVALLMARSSLAADTPPDNSPRDANDFYRQGMAAYEKRDFEGYFPSFSRALELAPGHPRLIYNLAAACAMTARTSAGLDHLERVARIRLHFDLEADSDFTAFRSEPRYRAVLDTMGTFLIPTGGGEVAFRVGSPDFIPEGIAHDSVTGDFFVSSVRKRLIARITMAGTQRTFVPEGRDGLWSVLGMGIDPVRRILWACSTALPNMNGGKADESSQGAVFAFDLGTERLLSRQAVAEGATGHECNDLVVSASGDLFVSDSGKGAILKLSGLSSRLETFLPEGSFGSPQGLALTPDGSRLYVADYARGLFRVELATRAITPLPVPDDVAARGIDGLLWHKGSLIAIQNGVTPHRVSRLHLDAGRERVIRQEFLGMSHALYDEPTLGVIVGEALHYIANSQWGKFSKDGTTLSAEGLVSPVILRLALP